MDFGNFFSLLVGIKIERKVLKTYFIHLWPGHSDLYPPPLLVTRQVLFGLVWDPWTSPPLPLPTSLGAHMWKILNFLKTIRFPIRSLYNQMKGGGALLLRERERGKKKLHKHSNFWRNIIYIREAAKKGIHYSGRTTKALTPPPELSGPRFFFKVDFKKVPFPLVVRAFTPPPLLVVWPLRKALFCGFPYDINQGIWGIKLTRKMSRIWWVVQTFI